LPYSFSSDRGAQGTFAKQCENIGAIEESRSKRLCARKQLRKQEMIAAKLIWNWKNIRRINNIAYLKED